MAYTRTQAGYTLIELLLYVVIVGTLLTATSVFFALNASTRAKTQVMNEVEQQGAYAVQYIARTIRNASAVSSPTIGTSSSSLTVTVPTAALSPTIFNVTGNTLQVKEGTAAAIPLTSSDVNVTNITFKNVSRSTTTEAVQISLTLSHINPSSRTEYNYTETFTTTAAVRP